MQIRKNQRFLLFTIFLSITIFTLMGGFQLFEDRDPQYTDQFDPYFMASMGLEPLTAPDPLSQTVLQQLGIDKSIPCDVAALIVAQAAPEQQCITTCTNNPTKPCSGYSSCYNKNISCNSAGKDQDGRNCGGCCFSCVVECPPPPDQPPSIDGTLNCSTWGNNGWCTGSKTLDLSASDPQGATLLISGDLNGDVFSCGEGALSCSIPLVEGVGIANYKVLSSLGLSDSGSVNWMLDSVPPAINGGLNGTAGENGWFVSTVEFSASASDATSGLAAFETSPSGSSWMPYDSSPLTFVDGSYNLQVRAIDVAGNVESISRTLNIDSVSPSLNRSITGTAGANGWYISDVIVEATYNDPDPSSGLAVNITTDGTNWGAYTVPLTLTEGIYELRIQAKDTAGNAVSTLDYVNVDTTPPTLSGSLSGTLGSANWYISTVQASVTVSDEISGIAYTEYSPDGGAWRVYSAPVNFDDGQHSIQFRTTDMAGLQTESEVFTFQVDTQGPHIELPSRWYIWESADFIVKDNHSKVVAVSYEIRDGQNRWKKVERSWTPNTTNFSHTISWNRVFADGVTAPIGSYAVRVYAEDAAGNVSRKDAQIIIPAPNATPLPTFTPSPTSTNMPIPTEEVFAPPVMPQATTTPLPQVAPSEPESPEEGNTIIFGSTPKEPASPSTTSSNILWGAAAAAAIGTFAATAAETKRRRDKKRAAFAKKLKERQKLQALWDANGAAIWTANQASKAKDDDPYAGMEDFYENQDRINGEMIAEAREYQLKLARERNELLNPPYAQSSLDDPLFFLEPTTVFDLPFSKNVVPLCLPGLQDTRSTTAFGIGGLHIGSPGYPGALQEQYSSTRGSSQSFLFTKVALDRVGDRAGIERIIPVGRTVAVSNYSSSYDVEIYKNLTRITIHEAYHFAGTDTPLMEIEADAYSVLQVETASGDRREIYLGDFETGNIAYSNILSNRDTVVSFWGEENFPHRISIDINIIADGMGTQLDGYNFDVPTINYP